MTLEQKIIIFLIIFKSKINHMNCINYGNNGGCSGWGRGRFSGRGCGGQSVDRGCGNGRQGDQGQGGCGDYV